MKKYNVIYADPPWKTKAGRPFSGYKKVDGVQIFNSVNNRSRDLSYDSLSVADIAAFPVKDLINSDAHLYLWVTNQYLLQAASVIESWGFKYSTALVWAKNAMGGGLGGTFKITTEYLLFCTKGSLPAKKSITGTWFNVKRQYENGAPCHSKKPDFFRDIIQDISPGPYLEMFARSQKEGWDVFGNQVDNSIELLNK